MSTKYITWAFEQHIATPGAKLVLVALADHANKKTGETFVGQKRIAEKTSQGVRTVRRHLDWLEENGFISREVRRRDNGSRSSDLTTLNMKEKGHD